MIPPILINRLLLMWLNELYLHLLIIIAILLTMYNFYKLNKLFYVKKNLWKISKVNRTRIPGFNLMHVKQKLLIYAMVSELITWKN